MINIFRTIVFNQSDYLETKAKSRNAEGKEVIKIGPSAMAKRLTNMGQEGWRLINTIAMPNGCAAIFVKQVEPKPRASEPESLPTPEILPTQESSESTQDNS